MRTTNGEVGRSMRQQGRMWRAAAGLAAILAGLLLAQPGLLAQGRGGFGGRGGRGGPPPAAKAAAPVDLTGYWVSVVTEDWRYRMVMPTKGDFQGVPMTPEARQIADAWTMENANQGDPCRSYGAPVALRVPGRLHITWEDDETLRIDTDAGKQTRMLHFGDWKAPGGPATRQGDSVAEWERSGGRGGGSSNGWMHVQTTNLLPGLLRKNGVPYSDKASLEEYFDEVQMPDGTPMIVVTTITTDPEYLRQPFIITSHFKKEPDGGKWHPTECSATW